MRKVSAWVATHAPAGTRWGKRTLSLLLSLVLCLSLLPGAAFAADSGSHVHNWSYTASGDTITAACTADGCPTPSGSVTISAPDNLTYNGREKAANLTWTAWADDETKEAVRNNIHYEKSNGTGSSAAPSSAGTYTASITLGNATASVEYTIAKAAAPTITALPLTTLRTGLTGDAQSQTVTWSGIPEDANPTSFTVIEKSVTVPGHILFTTCAISDDKVLTYDFVGATADDVGQKITIPVEIVMENYENATANVEIKLSAREEQGDFRFEEKTMTKAYGDEDFTFAATGNVDGSTVTYESKNPAVAAVDETTGKVHIVGVGTAEIHATASEADGYEAKTILYKLTVTKRQLTVKYDDQAITVGDAFPEITISYGNFAPGHSKEDVIASGPSSYVLTDSNGLPVSADTARSTAGTYTIENNGDSVTLKDGMEKNYEVPTVQSGVLTVSARPSFGIYVPTYSATVDETEHGSVSVSPKSAAKGATVTVTVTPDKGYTLETLTVTDKNGKEVKLTEKNGKYTFTMPASSVTVTATFMDDNTMLNFFVDVKAGDYYYDAVLWAAQKGITSGTDDTHFSPNNACTRAQIVTFLWRAAGSPVVNYAMNMTDVSEDAYYAEAVRWALSEGITTGTTATTFSPDETCTRAQAVTFLARALNAKASGKAAFSDVPTGSYYADAVAWAVENGVTNGIADTLFGPDNSCTRGQIVTFLWRAYSK